MLSEKNGGVAVEIPFYLHALIVRVPAAFVFPFYIIYKYSKRFVLVRYCRT